MHFLTEDTEVHGKYSLNLELEILNSELWILNINITPITSFFPSQTS